MATTALQTVSADHVREMQTNADGSLDGTRRADAYLRKIAGTRTDEHD
jgi:hypothetical protein